MAAEELSNTDLPDEEQAFIESLPSMGSRVLSDMTLNKGDSSTLEAELQAKLGYSAPIAMEEASIQVGDGWLRDLAVEDPLERAAIRGSLAIRNYILNARCTNREGRIASEEAYAKDWEGRISTNHRTSAPAPAGGEDGEEEGAGGAARKMADDPNMVNMNNLLDKWNTASRSMAYLKIYEAIHGREATRPHYGLYKTAKANKEKAERDANELPYEYNGLFWCRARVMAISIERICDVELGRPQADYTALKRAWRDGGKTSQLMVDMPWIFQVGYEHGLSTLMGGDEHRKKVTGMYGGTQYMAQPAPPPQPYPEAGPGQPAPGAEQGPGAEPKAKDQRRPLFGAGAAAGPPKQRRLKRIRSK